MPQSKLTYGGKTRRLLLDVDASTPLDGPYVKDYSGQKRVTVIEGVLSAEAVEVYADGTDQTTKLNTAFAYSNVYAIHLNNPKGGDYTINGTLTIPAGKHLVFNPGCKLIGTGTVSGGIIAAPHTQWIFGGSVVADFTQTIDGWASVNWWGAGRALGAAIDTPAIQAAVNFCAYADYVANLKFMSGEYRLNKGILVWRDNTADGNPDAVRINIQGAGTTYSADTSETVIICEHVDNFGFGIQKGKGFKMSKITLRGPNALNYSVATAWNFSTTYNNASCRTNRYSPFSAIVIDPIGSVAGAGISNSDRYPDFEAYYNDGMGSGGSTDCHFEEIVIDGFYVGICLSPNGFTQNNESHSFEKFWIRNCRDGYAACNSQERLVTCRHFKMWDSVRCAFNCTTYGLQRGDAPIIEHLNVAGTVLKLFQFQGFFPTVNMNNVHAESFRYIGEIFTNTCIIRDSHFNFGFKEDNTLAYPISLVNANKIKFENCNLFFYLGEFAVPMNFGVSEQGGHVIFERCLLHNHGMGLSGGSWTWDNHNISYIDCYFYITGQQLKDKSLHGKGSSHINHRGLQASTYGKMLETVSESGATYEAACQNFVQRRRVTSLPIRQVPLGSITLTVNPLTPGVATCTISSLIGKSALYVNRIVSAELPSSVAIPDTGGTAQKAQIGRIVSISGAGLVTIDHLWEGVITATAYNLIAEFITPTGIPTLGLATNGSATITNVISERAGTNDVTTIRNTLVNGVPYDVTTGAASTITLASNYASTTDDRAIICDFLYEEWGESAGYPADIALTYTLFTRGAFYLNTNISTKGKVYGWNVIRSGVSGSAYPPEFQTVYNRDDEYFSLATDDDYSVTGPGQLIQVIVRPTAATPSFELGTTAGGTQLINTTTLVVDEWNVLTPNPNFFDETPTLIYFSGITDDTEIKLVFKYLSTFPGALP
jgi:hypothetical protein